MAASSFKACFLALASALACSLAALAWAFASAVTSVSWACAFLALAACFFGQNVLFERGYFR